MARGGLGKGLSALLPGASGRDHGLLIREIPLDQIDPNPFQPREKFADESLKELALSIKTHGVLEPIILRAKGKRYEIIAGERRYKASKLAGLKTIPAIIKNYNDLKTMEIALVENLQREDLNPLEQAKTFMKLIKEFKLTQEEVARRTGKSRSAITNTIRLLNLPEEIQTMILEEKITQGHARALLSLDDKKLQKKIAKKIVEEGLSVREVEALVKEKIREKKEGKPLKPSQMKGFIRNYKTLEHALQDILLTKVKISHNGKRGMIQIRFSTDEDLKRIIELLFSDKLEFSAEDLK